MNSIITILLTINNLFSQTPIINSINQIDEKVRSKLLLSSQEYINFKNLVNQSTTSLQNQINNISTTTLSNIFVLKSGDIINGDLQVNGAFGVGAFGIWSGGDIYSLGKITLGNGIYDNQKIKFTINDKTSYLDYNKLFIKGDIDIEGNYLINGIPINLSTSSINNYYIENNNYYGLLSDKVFIIGNSTETLKLIIQNNITNINNETIELNANSLNVYSTFTYLGTENSHINISTNNINLNTENLNIDTNNTNININNLNANINNLYIDTNQTQLFGNPVILGRKTSTYEFPLYICMSGQYAGMVFTNTDNLCTQNNGTLYSTGVIIK